MTVRQIFYALTVRYLIEKTEAEYNGTVVRLLTRLRRDKVIPYHWISDNTRWVRQPQTYSGIADFLEQTARFYRRALWADADCQVQIWSEKDALAGVIAEETMPYDVPLRVSRGFSSETYLQSAAAAIESDGRPAFIYQFGDHDPSGVWIADTIEERLRRHAPAATIHFERVAVTPAQLRSWRLPTRPTKREGNTHARRFDGASVELDAIPPRQLRALVRECIERHVDHKALAVLKAAERSERQLLSAWNAGEDEPVDAEHAARLHLDHIRQQFLSDKARWRQRSEAIGQLLDASGLLFDLLSEAKHGDGGIPIVEKLSEARDKILTVISAIHGGEAR